MKGKVTQHADYPMMPVALLEKMCEACASIAQMTNSGSMENKSIVKEVPAGPKTAGGGSCFVNRIGLPVVDDISKNILVQGASVA